MVLRVGVGFERIWRDAEAARRSGVDSFGLGGFDVGGNLEEEDSADARENARRVHCPFSDHR